MKHLIICLILSTLTSSVIGKTYSIRGIFVEKESGKEISKKFSLLLDDSLIYVGASSIRKGFVIKSLKAGTYNLKFENTHEQKFSRQIEVNRNIRKLKIEVDIYDHSRRYKDFLSTSYKMPSELLALEDSLIYRFLSSGCYFNAWMGLRIIKREEGFVAEYLAHKILSQVKLADNETHLNLDSVIFTRILSEPDLQKFRQFEQVFWRSYRIQYPNIFGCNYSTSSTVMDFEGVGHTVFYEVCKGYPQERLKQWVLAVFGKNIYGESPID